MRIVVALDGELLVPRQPQLGIEGQKVVISRTVDCLGELLKSQHELVLTHGNSPQVGYVLLRSEMASHAVHAVPLDVCGPDTQGATGYMLQQSILNQLRHSACEKEVFTMITQVVVDPHVPAHFNPVKGIGPFFDKDKARRYTQARGWDFILAPGYGYQRAVPSLMPERIVEINSILTVWISTGTWLALRLLLIRFLQRDYWH